MPSHKAKSRTGTGKSPLRVLMLGPELSQCGGIAAVENLILAHPPKNIELRHLATHSEGFILWRVLLYIGSCFRFMHQLWQWQPALVHIHFSKGGSVWRKLLLARLARACGRRVLLHAHGARFHLFFAALPPVMQWCLRRLFSGVDNLLVLGEEWCRYYREVFPCLPEISILPNPVAWPAVIPERSPGINEKVNILYCGRLGERKGVFDLLSAIAGLPAEVRHHTHFFLAGDGALTEADRRIQKLRIASTVTLCGWQSGPAKDALFWKADIFVLPSYDEAMPMAILEALAWGLPVIATPVGAIPEIINHDHNGLLVNPGDIHALLDALTQLIQKPEQRRSMGRAARESVRQLAVENYAERLGEIYRKLGGTCESHE